LTSLGHPCKFQLVSRPGSVTARHLVVGVSQTAALNRGRRLYSAGRPSRWALAHILVAVFFSERELTFTFAICCRPSVCRLSRLSVCLSVTLVHPTQAAVNFGNFSTPFGTVTICRHQQKILRRSLKGNSFTEGVKHKRGSEI